MRAFAVGVLEDEAVLAAVEAFSERIAVPVRAAVLGQKLVQLTMPGVPDVYQGTEVVDLSLVDPDNRRAGRLRRPRATRLARLDAGGPPADLSDEKLLVTSRALRLRREHPEWFVGAPTTATYTAVATSTGNAVAFGRGVRSVDGGAPQVVVVATRLATSLERNGGWGQHTVVLPALEAGAPGSTGSPGRVVPGGAVAAGGPARFAARRAAGEGCCAVTMAQQSSPTSAIDAIPRPLSSKDLRKAVGKLLRGKQPLPIVQAGHPVLREVAQPYDGELSPELMADLVAAMRESMHDAPGVGLAAPQVGLGLALAVVEDSGDDEDDPRDRSDLPFRVIVNPVYEPVDTELVVFEEGCLSVVGYEAERARFRSVRVRGQDETGRGFDEVFSGWAARIMQHEIDHLSGTLYIDDADLASLAWTGRV